MRTAHARRDFSVPQSPVIGPWDYVRLRREAAGLSIEQAAAPFYKRPEHRADVERNIRALETPGMRFQHGVDMSRAFPFSIDVYRQLADCPPVDHPRVCCRCGWDQWTDQPDRLNQQTRWSEQDPSICTSCEQRAAGIGRK